MYFGLKILGFLADHMCDRGRSGHSALHPTSWEPHSLPLRLAASGSRACSSCIRCPWPKSIHLVSLAMSRNIRPLPASDPRRQRQLLRPGRHAVQISCVPGGQLRQTSLSRLDVAVLGLLMQLGLFIGITSYATTCCRLRPTIEGLNAALGACEAGSRTQLEVEVSQTLRDPEGRPQAVALHWLQRVPSSLEW